MRVWGVGAGVGAWVAGSGSIAVGLIARPWVYGLVFVVSMLVSFKQ